MKEKFEKLTEQDLQYMKELYKNNTPIIKIAKEINCNTNTVRYWKNKNFRKTTQYSVLEDQISTVKDLLSKGYSQRSIADYFNCSKSVVSKFLTNNELKKISSKDKILPLLEKGYSNKEISDQLQISYDIVANNRTKFNKERSSVFPLIQKDQSR